MRKFKNLKYSSWLLAISLFCCNSAYSGTNPETYLKLKCQTVDKAYGENKDWKKIAHSVIKKGK